MVMPLIGFEGFRTADDEFAYRPTGDKRVTGPGFGGAVLPKPQTFTQYPQPYFATFWLDPWGLMARGRVPSRPGLSDRDEFRCVNQRQPLIPARSCGSFRSDRCAAD